MQVNDNNPTLDPDYDCPKCGASCHAANDEVVALRAEVERLEERERQLEAALGWDTPNAIRYRVENPDLYPAEQADAEY